MPGSTSLNAVTKLSKDSPLASVTVIVPSSTGCVKGSSHGLATTTSKVFKDSKKTLKEITSELNVDAALEIAVLCIGEDSICFQTRLIKPGSEEVQLWTADYKIPRNEILNWYNKVSKQIAEEVKVKLTPEERSLLSENRLIDKDAYDAYLQGRMYWDDLSKEGLEKAINYLTLAIEKDPTWAPPYIGLVAVWGGLMQMGFVSPEVAMPDNCRSGSPAYLLPSP